MQAIGFIKDAEKMHERSQKGVTEVSRLAHKAMSVNDLPGYS